MDDERTGGPGEEEHPYPPTTRNIDLAQDLPDTDVETAPPEEKKEEAPGRRGGFGRLVAAALVGALAGGAVAFPVAQQVVEERVAERAPAQVAQVPPAQEREPSEAGSTAAIVESIRPSVVAINTQAPGLDLFLEPVPAPGGAGTGIVLDESGHIITNNHVVEGAREIEVVMSNGRSFPATLVGRDEVTDVAVLEIEAQNLTPAPLGNSDDLRVGDRVVAVGHALALPGGPTVTEGIVSALDRFIQVSEQVTLEHIIQTDAAINPGNSGGPLLDCEGRVIGINTAIAGGAQNIGFSIAIAPAIEIINELIESGEIVRGFLGVSMVTVTPEIVAQQELSVEEGVLIVQVGVDTPADAAGLEPGDVIVEIDGRPVTTSEEIQEFIQGKAPGDNITLIVVRGEERFRVGATLTERTQ